jgi:hypothetical protein
MFSAFLPIKQSRASVHMSAIDQHPAKVANLRRSQRVYLSVEVVVSFQATNGIPLSEETRTLVVNAHGALVLLRRKVALGELLTLRNVKTEKELACRVVDVGPAAQAGQREIGIEFVIPSPRFWPVAFPPADWSPRSPEAKGHRPQIVGPPIAPKQG